MYGQNYTYALIQRALSRLFSVAYVNFEKA